MREEVDEEKDDMVVKMRKRKGDMVMMVICSIYLRSII